MLTSTKLDWKQKTRVQILTQPVVLISCGLGKVTDLWWWAMLGSSGSTVAAVVHPAPVAASTCFSFLEDWS